MLLLALLLTQQDAPIIMALPRPASSRLTLETSCLSNNFLIVVNNDGFISKLVTATVNGKQVKFQSETGDLAEVLSKMHSVTMQAGRCDAKGDIGISIGGVDMNKLSPSFGRDVLFRFQSKVGG